MKYAITNSIEKLEDNSLECVLGGGSRLAYAAGGIALMSSFGCGIASCVYLFKANKFRALGDTANCEKYLQKAQNRGIASTTLIGTAMVLNVIGNQMSRAEFAEAIAQAKA